VVGDRIVKDLPWVTMRADAEAMLRRMPRFNGGGNEGESSLEAVQAALARPWRERSVRCVVLITDEPALIGQLRPERITEQLQRSEVITFVVSPAIGYFQTMARQTLGTWYDVTAPRGMDDLLALLRRLGSDIAHTAEAVHRLAGGSVVRYRLLGPDSGPRTQRGSG
jgi:hypothetical protein